MNFKRFYAVLGIAFFGLGCKSLQQRHQENSTPLVQIEQQVQEKSIKKETPNQRSKYHASRTILADLIHTKLEVQPVWEKSQLIGKATITAKQHFYPSNQLLLDAKGMEIKSVTENGQILNFSYNDTLLSISLSKTYNSKDTFEVVIEYISKPEERSLTSGKAITSDKGLYFINPKGETQNKMPQIWTQGETESNSVWFPTIDSPNAKSSQEIWITVDSKYTTLSNGLLTKTIDNKNGTKTDIWKQEKVHAPYLFMFAVGEYKIVKDSYTKPDGSKMEVNYYVEPEWEQYAKAIFGETPAMIEYFSKLLGVNYQWDKYHQIVVRDYVSGAMENTGAVIFGDYVYKNHRALLDDNDQSTIAHELFHHWFGDLVTCESWSNLTLNESFANYSQYLWDEHRYGVDEADYQAEIVERNYYQAAKNSGYHNLVWFDYEERDEMFDAHSYNKGGRILHMLRSYLGDDAFFKGIQLYLKENSFQSAEFHQLRIAFEKVSGEDLNWFFNQWYLDKAHPVIASKQSIHPEKNTVTINLEQLQNLELAPIYKLPMNIAIYDDKRKHIYPIVFDQLKQTFEFKFEGNLNCVVVDDQEMLLGMKREQKPIEQYVYQYYNATKYKTRKSGLINGAASKNKDQLILDALNDPFWDIRRLAIGLVERLSDERKNEGIEKVKSLLMNDSKSQVREASLQFLARQIESQEVMDLCKKSLQLDSSYLVVTTALNIIASSQTDDALIMAYEFENEPASGLQLAIAQIYAAQGDSIQADFFNRSLKSNWLNAIDEVGVLSSMTMYLVRQDVATIQKLLPLYSFIKENGGYYSKMFFAQNIQYLQKAFNEKMLELKAKNDTESEAKLDTVLKELERLSKD